MFRNRILPFLFFLICLALGFLCLMAMETQDLILLLSGALLPRLVVLVVDSLEVPVTYGPIARIPGRWQTLWTCDRDKDGPEQFADVLRVYRIGSWIWGKCRFSAADRPYVIKGRIVRGGMVHGRWKSTQRGSDYHGVFIMQMGEDPAELRGAWLGTSEHLGIRQGQWLWKR